LLFPPASGIDGPGDTGLLLARLFTWIAACLLMMQIQKVSAQLKVTNPVPQMVLNNQ